MHTHTHAATSVMMCSVMYYSPGNMTPGGFAEVIHGAVGHLQTNKKTEPGGAQVRQTQAGE